MNRAEAIEFAHAQQEIFGGKMGEFLEYVENELTQTNTSNTLNALDCVDLISRQAAIDGLYEMASDTDHLCTLGDYIKFLESLSSAESRWIPVTDAEPQESGDYLLYRPHFWGANKGQITVCYWNGHEWSDNYKNDAERFLPKVYGMAWMPLPQPWKGEDDV